MNMTAVFLLYVYGKFLCKLSPLDYISPVGIIYGISKVLLHSVFIHVSAIEDCLFWQE